MITPHYIGAMRMQRESKALNILNDNRGISLVFVLGVMMFLMAIGVSVVAAASANVGFMNEQREHGQVILLDESIHKNIMYSLQHEPNNEDLLAAQLLWALFRAKDEGSGSVNSITLEVTLDNGEDLESGPISVEPLTFSFTTESVVITDFVPAVYVDVYEDKFDDDGVWTHQEFVDRVFDGKNRIPKSATVNAAMTVIVEINANSKNTTSRATYEFTGGRLSDDPPGLHYKCDVGCVKKEGTCYVYYPARGCLDGLEMEITDYGKWRLIKHENIDSRN